MRATKIQPKSRAEGEKQLARSLERMHFGCDSETLGIPITEVGVGHCRFIIDDRVFPAVCCGAVTSRAGSWCEAHAQIVFTPGGLSYIRDRGRAR